MTTTLASLASYRDAAMTLFRSVVAGVVALAVVGCGSKVVEVAAADTTGENLFQFSKVYVAAQKKLKRAPKNADDLKTVASEFPDLAKHLVSPNDNQPYAVAWGYDLQNPADETTVVACEKVGKDGMRYALTPTGVVRLSAEQFAAAKFAPGFKP